MEFSIPFSDHTPTPTPKVLSLSWLQNAVPTDLLAQDIREILTCLGEITGQIPMDEILGNIFWNFCIGKRVRLCFQERNVKEIVGETHPCHGVYRKLFTSTYLLLKVQ